MRFLIIVGQILLASLFTLNVSAQDKAQKQPKFQTYEFDVEGVCGQCKQRIEKAALIKGVRTSEWDKDSGKLKVIYRTKTVDTETIEKAIAETGHDTENVKAKEEDYQKLPSCCAYKTVDPH